MDPADIDRIVELVIERLRHQRTNSAGAKPKIYGSAADESWGYKFGCDGLMSVLDASSYLAVSGRTLDRLAVKQKIRKGRYPSGVRAFCKRSVTDFAQSLEE